MYGGSHVIYFSNKYSVGSTMLDPATIANTGKDMVRESNLRWRQASSNERLGSSAIPSTSNRPLA